MFHRSCVDVKRLNIVRLKLYKDYVYTYFHRFAELVSFLNIWSNNYCCLPTRFILHHIELSWIYIFSCWNACLVEIIWLWTRDAFCTNFVNQTAFIYLTFLLHFFERGKLLSVPAIILEQPHLTNKLLPYPEHTMPS